MEKIRLHIKSENPVTLEIPNPSEELKKHVIDTMLSKVHIIHTMEVGSILPLGQELVFAETEYPEEVYAKQEAEPTEPVSDDLLAELKATLDTRDLSSAKEEIRNRMEEDKKNNEEKMAAIFPNAKDHYLTGIKEDPDGTKRYRCRYACTNPDCRTKSSHYIPEYVTSIRCHNCQTDLDVERSMPSDEVLESDPTGAFFVAGRRQPYYQFAGLEE